MFIVPKQKDATPSADGRSMSERSESEAANISRGLMINEVQFGLLDASNMARGISEEGVDGIFALLAI
jgi:hypothetical protein